MQASCSGLESLPGSTGSCDREAACRQMAGPSMWAKWGRAGGGGVDCERGGQVAGMKRSPCKKLDQQQQ